MDLSRIPPQPAPGFLNVVVEVPAGGRNKYEYLPGPGLMALDRVMHPSVQYPFDYGFVPNTLADDGSPLDAMVVMLEPTFPGCLILCRPIGLLEVIDAGIEDAKLLCIPANDPNLDEITDLQQFSRNRLEGIAEFFRTHRGITGNTEILSWRDRSWVGPLVERCILAAGSVPGGQASDQDGGAEDRR